MTDPPPYPGTPRWVKVFGAVVLILILLLVVLLVTDIGGGHGPGRHLGSEDVLPGEPPGASVEPPRSGADTPPPGGRL